jgi:hypothetical protein
MKRAQAAAMATERPPAAPVTHASHRGARARRAGALGLLIAGLAVVLAACGGDGGSGSAPAQSSASSGQQSGAVAFAQCMRSHGVTDFPDPRNGRFLINSAVQNNPHFQSGVQACQHLLGPGGLSNGGGAGSSRNTQLLRFAHCMQTHGVPQFPDPSANGALVRPQGLNPNSPQFQQAWQKCQSQLPGGLQGQQP